MFLDMFNMFSLLITISVYYINNYAEIVFVCKVKEMLSILLDIKSLDHVSSLFVI